MPGAIAIGGPGGLSGASRVPTAVVAGLGGPAGPVCNSLWAWGQPRGALPTDTLPLTVTAVRCEIRKMR